MISSAAYMKHVNCSHNIDKYVEGKFVKDDYCFMCLEQINEIESESTQ